MILPPRKRIRLEYYDYRQGGAYFCTVCVHRSHRRKDVFARIDAGNMRLNRFGSMVEACWHDLPNHATNASLDAFVVMPNHIHLVIVLDGVEIPLAQPRHFGPQSAGSLHRVMADWKAAISREIGKVRGGKTLVWQPRFYDRVVRNEDELQHIRRYIENNPANWLGDRCHPQHPEFERAWQGISPDCDLDWDK